MRVLLGVLALVAVARSLETSPFADNADAKLKVPELIAKYGYPVEVHNITTSDGYILTAHRIPYGKKCGPGGDKRVIWLQHGLLGDSSNYIIAGTEKGIGYNLADECYDVWMGNYRGNQYSRRHVTFDPDVDKEAFWSYSWDEIGRYDIPAFIDYVLAATGVDGIYYIGHSMGTTGFWVTMSERPEYNSKIKLMNAFAPVAYTEHMISPIRHIAPFEGQLEWFLSMFGLQEFLPTSKFMEFLGQSLCHQNSTLNDICNNVLFLIAGYDSEQLDPDLLPTLLGHIPAGASARSLVHYAQGVNSGEFRKYNYGREKNQEIYGSPDPPQYNVEAITAPVAFYWGENDWLGAKADTYRLAERMPNLQRFFRVNHDKYNHFDFLWAKDNLQLLNRQVIDFMKLY